ncbi:hypothetical protein X743_27245 [Mesorhizobium sp. LNHC252B00]|nr:hypothetical protein X743_27245 [Mesorhizobium sp. LNHC252B00]
MIGKAGLECRTNPLDQFMHRQRREILGIIEEPTDFDHNVRIDVARQISHMLSPINVNIAAFLTGVESGR